MKVFVRECTIEDLYNLKNLSCSTYYDTFVKFNTKENMEAYLNYAYNIDKLKGELLNLESKFYFIYCDKTIAGYMKINDTMAQTDIYDENSLEVERLYIKKEYHGNGLGKVLMDLAINIAKNKNKSYIWLGVWEKNFNAQKFYNKFGFVKISSHPFIMGDDQQIDFILKKDL